MVNVACRRDYTARYFRLDDLANKLAVHHRSDPGRLACLRGLHDCDVLVLDDFRPTPITTDAGSELLNILAGREHRGATVVTSQFDPEDWYKSLHDAVVAESILKRIVSTSELNGPDMRRHAYAREEDNATTLTNAAAVGPVLPGPTPATESRV